MKPLYINRTAKHVILYTVFSVFFTILFSFISKECAYAATSEFTYYSYTKNCDVTYKGVSPSYSVAGVSVNLNSVPAILSDNGVALASVKHIFKNNSLGTFKFNKSSGKITVKYNGKQLVMYLGSTTAYLDGEEKTMSAAPDRIRYRKSNTLVTLVPTRFVAESLGLIYDWNASSSLVTIKEPVHLRIDGEDVDYTGSLGRVSCNGTLINLGKNKSIIRAENAMIQAKKVFSSGLKVQYSFDKKSKKVSFSIGDLTLNMKVGDKHAFVNDRLVIAPVAPCMIYNYDAGTNLLFVPGRFVAETLGFNYEWIESQKTTYITTTEKTGVADFGDNLVNFAYSEPCTVPDWIDSVDIASVFGTVDIPLPNGFDESSTPIDDRYYNDEIRITLKGDHSDFYRSKRLSFCNPYVLQIAITLDTNGDTVISLHTDGGMAYRYYFSDGIYHLTIDKPSKFYDKIVVLDAGHGDYDPGTVHGGYNEKDVNFSIVWDYLRPMFENSDIKAYFSRHDDTLVPLYDRAAFSAKVSADIFVSVHQNSSSNSAAKGSSVYYSTIHYVESPSGLNSEKMADLFLRNLTKKLGTLNRGAIDKGFVVVRDNAVPSVLLEMGFMSNAEERAKLVSESYKKREAKVIFDTIKEIFELYPTGRTAVYKSVGAVYEESEEDFFDDSSSDDYSEESSGEDTDNMETMTTDTAVQETSSNAKNDEFRAVWIAYYDFDNVKGKGKDAFVSYVRQMFDNVKAMNMNAVVVHVRPFSDAMYRSKYYPFSSYASGTQGLDPGFDPLKIMVQEAHDRGLEFHAWLNPYRVTNSSMGTDVMKLAENNPARVWLTDDDTSNDRNVLQFGKQLYYNPASNEVRKLIRNGIKEIVKNYDVDGIHFDDYFYPDDLGTNYRTNFDAEEYDIYVEGRKASGKKYMSIENWRRDNVNVLIKGIYSDVKKIKSDVVFGISPGGFIDYLDRDFGFYVDYHKWMSTPGYIDYICPQVYWNFDPLNKYPYDSTLWRWIDARTCDSVKVYAGLPAYKVNHKDVDTAYGGKVADQWLDDNLLYQMVWYGRGTGRVDGYIFFDYADMVSSRNKGAVEQVKEIFNGL